MSFGSASSRIIVTNVEAHYHYVNVARISAETLYIKPFATIVAMTIYLKKF